MKKYPSKKIIQEVKKIVERECKKHSNFYGYDAWRHHIIFVVKFSKMLAIKMKADKEILELAALLHDIGSLKGDYDNHHISGAEESEKILRKFRYPQEKIDKIKHCIYAHRGSKFIKRTTIEARCLASADAMAHFEDIPSLFSLAFVKLKMNVDGGVEYLLGKIERDWDKLIPEAKEIIREKYKAIKLLLVKSHG